MERLATEEIEIMPKAEQGLNFKSGVKTFRLSRIFQAAVWGGLCSASLGFCASGAYDMATDSPNPYGTNMNDAQKTERYLEESRRGTDKLATGAIIAALVASAAVGNKGVKI